MLHFPVRGWFRPVELCVPDTHRTRGLENRSANHPPLLGQGRVYDAPRPPQAVPGARPPRCTPSSECRRRTGASAHANEQMRSAPLGREWCLCSLLSMSWQTRSHLTMPAK